MVSRLLWIICMFIASNVGATTEPVNDILSGIYNKYSCPMALSKPINEVEAMLHREAKTLNVSVINKALTTLECANERHIVHNHILTIIDYSLPSSEKRLWVFDLKHLRLLYNTYVSHGITTGVLSSNIFSNRNNSKASSLGVYTTDDAYFGRHGPSLKLDGLESGFNDKASQRAIVMHGGWYVEEQFIKRYGRAGRSWGCPAVPDRLIEQIIDKIKDKSLFVIYSPDEQWLSKSRFLRCDRVVQSSVSPIPQGTLENNTREDVLFVDLNGNQKFQENKPLLTVSANTYEQVFKKKAPVERMLRRQINDEEYIALSPPEFAELPSGSLDQLTFVVPVLNRVRGYYRTETHLVNMGKIKAVLPLTESTGRMFTMETLAKSSIHIVPTNQFIRWVGL